MSKCPAFEVTERGYTARGWYGDLGSEGRIRIIHETRGVVFDGPYPAYKIWNVAAHLGDIIDSLEQSS